MVLCASYSGDTEETLACYESAGALGAARTVVTTGGRLAEMARADGVPVIPLPAGFQPRAAVAYMTVAALEVAALSGAGPRLTSEIDVAASHSEQLVERVGTRRAPRTRSPRRSRAVCTARRRSIAGAGLTAPIAYRWKTQINENAKQPCFAHELPELDHNEIAGWEGAHELGASRRCSSTTQTRTRASRSGWTSPSARSRRARRRASRVQTRGQTAIERVISLVLLGDLVSIYLAALRGVDPGPVTADRRAQGGARRGAEPAARGASGGRPGVPRLALVDPR